MLRRLGGFVDDMKQKIHELPASCATWDWKDGKIPNGWHPANTINLAHKQYPNEHRTAP